MSVSRTAHRYNFGTLANQIRLDILQALRGGERNVTQLTKALGLNQSTVSHNLRRLTVSGFVRMRQDGAFRVYSLNEPVVIPFLEHMEATVRLRGRKTEKALKESEDRFRKLLDVTPWLIAVYSDGKVDFINEAGARMLGAKNAAALIGKPISAFLPPERLGELAASLKDIEAGKLTVPRQGEVVGVDGRRVAIETASAPIIFEGRRAYLTVARDVTGEAAMREEVARRERQQRAMLEALMTAMPDIILRFRRDGTFVECKTSSPAALYARPEDFLGKRVEDVMPRDIADETKRTIEAALETGKMQVFTYELAMPGGPTRFEARIVPTGDGEALAIVRSLSETAEQRG